MIVRKIVSNIIVGFFVFPLILQTKHWTDFNINPIEQYGSVADAVIFGLFGDPFYLLNSAAFSMVILLPFQLIKDHYANRGKKISFMKKVLFSSTLILILICIFGSFSNIWWVPWYKNFVYIAYSGGLGLICTALLYPMVDQYIEKEMHSQTKNDSEPS